MDMPFSFKKEREREREREREYIRKCVHILVILNFILYWCINNLFYFIFNNDKFKDETLEKYHLLSFLTHKKLIVSLFSYLH